MFAVTDRVVKRAPFPVEKHVIWHRILDATSVERIKLYLCVILVCFLGNNTTTVLSLSEDVGMESPYL